MIQRLRLATPEEVEAIKPNTDLDPTCKVLALDTALGVPIAVIRLAVEMDPCFYPKEFGAKQIAMFSRDIINYLWAQNVERFYFNIDATDTNWANHLKAEGCEQISPMPQLRFKRTI
jgi:hypothetical protein